MEENRVDIYYCVELVQGRLFRGFILFCRRSTVEQALAHPYLSQYYDPNDEPVFPHPSLLSFEAGIDEMSKEELKRLIFEEVAKFAPTHSPLSNSNSQITSDTTVAAATVGQGESMDQHQ